MAVKMKVKASTPFDEARRKAALHALQKNDDVVFNYGPGSGCCMVYLEDARKVLQESKERAERDERSRKEEKRRRKWLKEKGL